jgi:RNA polymerase-interacting CarD/CdnL/TRCF family regulator
LTKYRKDVIITPYYGKVGEYKMFKVGDLAVYPAQGVGVIEAIENREVMGKKQPFYVMKIMGNGMKIMIPTTSAKAVGLGEGNTQGI